jgi:hypothetical protein
LQGLAFNIYSVPASSFFRGFPREVIRREGLYFVEESYTLIENACGTASSRGGLSVQAMRAFFLHAVVQGEG